METEKNSLNFNDNGTITDSKTGLVWMRPFVGQGWSDNLPYGDSNSFTWHEATAKYGRGREVKIPKEFETPYFDVGNEYKSKPKLCKESYEEYKFGNGTYEFAGFNDWRMPLVEEVFTLIEAGESFGHIFIWTANSSDFYKIIPSGVMNFLGLTNTHAWWTREKQIFADIHVNDSNGIKLVRLGNLFQAVY